jgi:hypothetical protein
VDRRKYNLTEDKLFGYGQRVTEKIVACGLHGVTNVPIMVPGAGPGAPEVQTPFIENYGMISMTECCAHGTTIMAAQDRHNQN